MLALSPEELHIFERGIVLTTQRHEQESYRSNGKYTRFFHHCEFSVKYNDHVLIERECEALRRLYDVAIKGRATAPHVPRVVHYFNIPDGFGFIVMEQIAVCEVSNDDLCRQAASAVLWLREQRMDIFGSLGRTNPCHTVFQGGRAPQPFTTVEAAQIYLNVVRVSLSCSIFTPACPDFSSTCKALDRVRQRRQPWMPPIADINLRDDTVVLTQSDMDRSNFGVALDGRPVIFDAATIQALPKTLADFTLLRTTAFARDVSAHLFKPDEIHVLLMSASFTSLAEVRSYLRVGNDDLGKLNSACFSLGADTLAASFFP